MACETSNGNILERILQDPSAEPSNLPLSLLEAITNNFSEDHKIGTGGFAVVYKGSLQNGIVWTVAVKRLSEKFVVEDKTFYQELHSLMKAKHKNIVRFLGYCANTEEKCVIYEGKNVMADIRQKLLCFEFMPKGSLDQYITDACQGLEWKTRYRVIKGICEGLHYLHDKNILHLDLKPANILLDDDMEPKIADFGLSRFFDGKESKILTSNPYGSLGYMAPEHFSGEITPKLDVYSLGVIILEILTGKKGHSEVEDVLESWKTRFKASQEGDTWLEDVRVCTEIGLTCIDSNPKKRPVTGHIIEALNKTNVYGFIETGFCTQYPVTKIGTWGGNGGCPVDITEATKHLESIIVRAGSVVDSIQFSYVDYAGQKHTAGPWGSFGGDPHTIQLAESEVITEVSGTVLHGIPTVISSIRFVTNLQTYGPWGEGNGTPFTVPVPPGSGVVGFFGRCGVYLDAIGVYVRPL